MSRFYRTSPRCSRSPGFGRASSHSTSFAVTPTPSLPKLHMTFSNGSACDVDCFSRWYGLPDFAVLFSKYCPTCYVLRYGVCDSAVLFKILPVRPYRGTAYVILRYFSRYRPHSTYCGTAYVILRYLYKILPIRYVLRCGLCISTVFFRYCPTAVRPTYFYAVHMVYSLTCRSVPYVPTSTAVLLSTVVLPDP
eukprot:SAG11_NODE_363_length_10162_cov_28.285004_7_plen_193_part_00